LSGKQIFKIALDSEPRLGQPRGAPARAERRGFVGGKPLGRPAGGPSNGRSKIGKFNLGVSLRLRSNLLYQKFLTFGSPPPAATKRRPASQKNLPLILIARASPKNSSKKERNILRKNS